MVRDASEASKIARSTAAARSSETSTAQHGSSWRATVPAAMAAASAAGSALPVAGPPICSSRPPCIFCQLAASPQQAGLFATRDNALSHPPQLQSSTGRMDVRSRDCSCSVHAARCVAHFWHVPPHVAMTQWGHRAVALADAVHIGHPPSPVHAQGLHCQPIRTDNA